MDDAERGLFHDATARIAFIVCLVVAIARIALALTNPAPAVVLDAAGYDQEARRLVTDGYLAYVSPDADVAHPVANAIVMPGYPVFLALIYAAAGPDLAPQPLVSVVQGVLSAFTLWGMFLIARRLAGSRAALVAVVLGALYPPFWWSYRYVLTEDLFTALCVWAAWSLVVAMDHEEGSLSHWIVLGLFAAAATYVRPVAGVWLVLAGFAVLVGSRGPRERIVRGGVLAVLVAVVCFVPWWVRNAGIYDRFVPLATKSAGGSITQLVSDMAERERIYARYDISYQDPAEEIESNRRLAAYSARLERDLWERDPVGLVSTRLRAVAISIATYHPNPYGGFGGFGGVTEVFHLALLGLGGLGVVILRRNLEAWVLLALPVGLLAVHAPTLIFSRYLYPMMPFVIVFASVGAVAILDRFGRGGTFRSAA